MIFICYSYLPGKGKSDREGKEMIGGYFRLETLSYGENLLTQSHWNEAKTLEFSRRQRLNL